MTNRERQPCVLEGDRAASEAGSVAPAAGKALSEVGVEVSRQVKGVLADRERQSPPFAPYFSPSFPLPPEAFSPLRAPSTPHPGGSWAPVSQGPDG